MTVKEISWSVSILAMDSEEIKDIEAILTMRKDMLRKKMMGKLKAGDSVRIGDNIRPIAIQGVIAKVVKVNKTTVSVTLPASSGKYAGDCKIPSTCCEKV
tara:strand:- start:51 stop:350 length:300 start_codon:yes stop_codon:yes gene_type:complete